MNSDKRVIDLGEFGKVVLDPGNMVFNEATLSNYLDTEAGHYDYFAQKFADAEYLAGKAEEAYDLKYASVFRIEKGEKASDKLAESRAKTDPDVAAAYQELLEAKHKAKLLQLHLKSWDKNHENAQNRGNTLRKEMDKLNPYVFGSQNADQINSDLNEFIKPVDRQPVDKL